MSTHLLLTGCLTIVSRLNLSSTSSISSEQIIHVLNGHLLLASTPSRHGNKEGRSLTPFWSVLGFLITRDSQFFLGDETQSDKDTTEPVSLWKTDRWMVENIIQNFIAQIINPGHLTSAQEEGFVPDLREEFDQYSNVHVWGVFNAHCHDRILFQQTPSCFQHCHLMCHGRTIDMQIWHHDFSLPIIFFLVRQERSQVRIRP
mmetsp:Transcript_33800/g.62111  ORF Transcript_33800/g.62111 Transcript_33800/m.62111 type:complete len:202 (-) Transcript_33800:1625-2230(-)